MTRLIILLFLFPSLSLAQDLMGLTGTLALAGAVQKAVDSGQYVFVMVIAIMIILQAVKIFFGSKFKSVRRNAPQYSAVSGGIIGGAASYLTGGDPVQGSVGGLLAGNAASGLYSSFIKPISKWVLPKIFSGSLWYIPLIGIVGFGAYLGIVKLLRKSPIEKRREIMDGFDSAMEKVNDKVNPTTKELEEWLSVQIN